MARVILRLKGGLGNQLFMYAAAYNFAAEKGHYLLVDQITGFKYDKQFKRSVKLEKLGLKYEVASRSDSLVPFDRVRRRIIKFNTLTKLAMNSIYLSEKGIDINKSFFKEVPSSYNNIYIEGYWQSEVFFKKRTEEFRALFRNFLKTSPGTNYKAELEDNVVAVHIRSELIKQDYTSIEKFTSYLSKAKLEVEKKLGSCAYLIFSDGSEVENKVINIFNDNKKIIIKGNSDIEDFRLMTECDGHILSRSTFGWWGAWLSENSRVVTMPRVKIYTNQTHHDMFPCADWVVL